MLEIVIDTSIYRKDPWRKSADFSALTRLAQSGKLRLHIPYFVQGELTTFLFSAYFNKHLRDIDRGIAKIKRNLPQELIAPIDELEEKYSAVKIVVEEYPNNEFSDWAQSINAVIHPVSETHGKKVAVDYFAGNLPFREVKRRDDIPDAFIWQVVVDLSDNLDVLHFIVGDNGLRDACASKQNISVYENLDEFLTSDFCRTLLVEENIKDNIQELLLLLPKYEEFLNNSLETQIVDALFGTEVESHWILDDNNVATISGVESLDESILYLDDANYYGNGVIIIPFQISLNATLNYAIFIADYLCLDDRRANRISVSPWNKHYHDAEEVYPLDVGGKIAINIELERFEEEKMTDKELEEMLSDAIISIDSFQDIEIPDRVWHYWENDNAT